MSITKLWKADEVVVLAHGCFDLLHLGHIQHLQEARSMGDRLVVSITGDEYVNKGSGRPHFTAAQRAAALRALSCVDEIVISNRPDATGVIREIRPAIYVKGIDYVGDELIGIQIERAAVEAHGGQIAFTKSQKFSSSRLINTEKFDKATCEFLELARSCNFRERILEAFAKADQLKIAFVGEIIIDEYRYVQGLGRASKELMLATVEVGSESFDGGSIAASKHAEWAKADWVGTGSFIKKTRYVDETFNRKLFDVYSQRKIDLSVEQRTSYQQLLSDTVADYDCVVAFDFGHGLLGYLERKILQTAKFLAVNAQTNAGNYGFNLITKYNSANLICIDEPEARLAASMQTEPIHAVINQLIPKASCPRYLITHGRYGSVYYDDLGFGNCPAFSDGGVDTIGAGDAVLAVVAPLVAAGLPLNVAAFVGNVAGAIKTSIVGHRRPVERVELIKTIESLLA